MYKLDGNTCYSVSAELLKGNNFSNHEAGLVGYHTNWIGDEGKYKTEHEFLKNTHACEASDFERQYQLCMMKIGFASDQVKFVYTKPSLK